VTSKAKEYRQHAEECLAAAQRIQNPEEQAIMLRIAQTWMDLAAQETPQRRPSQQQQSQPKDAHSAQR
jgi:hypothetical protein